MSLGSLRAASRFTLTLSVLSLIGFIGGLGLLPAGCMVPPARQHYDLAVQYRQQSQEATAKSQEWQAQRDESCASYWLVVAQTASQNAEVEESQALTIQKNFAQAVRIGRPPHVRPSGT